MSAFNGQQYDDVTGARRAFSASAAHCHQHTDLTTFFSDCRAAMLIRLLVKPGEEKKRGGATCDESVVIDRWCRYGRQSLLIEIALTVLE